MESLYVCLFSSGVVKVGRSVDPTARIAAHAERVACMGVQLSAHFKTAGVDRASAREAWLIARCASLSSSRHQSEWFDGVGFEVACSLAQQAVDLDLESLPDPGREFGLRLRACRIGARLTQAQLGAGLNVDGSDVQKAAICNWEVGRNCPDLSQLSALCKRLRVSADVLLGLAPIPAPTAASGISSLPGAASGPPA